ncbi:hypothetical protein ABIF94_002498 [Bradyrhizobium ottawaense]|uniref:hypothetical protein n=1 Tax=Bradyrhizobium ottawaense TaxID=931866 RepID=UPI00383383CF
MYRIAVIVLFFLCWPEISYALELNEIVGVWNNDGNSENLEIRKNGEVLDDRLGQGRIADGIVDGAGNLVIVYRNNDHCYYHATLVDDDHLRLANRSGPNLSPQCLLGQFTKVKPKVALPPKPLTGFELVRSVLDETFGVKLGQQYIDARHKPEWKHFNCDCVTGDFFHNGPYYWPRNRNTGILVLTSDKNIVEALVISNYSEDVQTGSTLKLYNSLKRRWGDSRETKFIRRDPTFARDELQYFSGVRYHYQYFSTNGSQGEQIFIALDH